jgi:predicted flap endonuclease-1-like 5' DNA nuclease
MRKHSFARFVASLLFLAALVIFLIAVYAAIRLSTGGLGGGWGLGWNGWMVLPILVSAFFSAGLLLLIGAAVFFLIRIETNLSTAIDERRNRPPAARVPVRPIGPVTPPGEGWSREPEPVQETVVDAVAETAGAAAVVAVVDTPAAEGEAAEEPLVVEEATVAEPAPAAEQPTAAEEPPVVEEPAENVAAEAEPVQEMTSEPPLVTEPPAIVEEPAANQPSQAATTPVEDEAVVTRGVTPSEPVVQAPRVEILAAEEDLASEAPIEHSGNGTPPVETAAHLPGAEEAARIAAEMAALKAAGPAEAASASTLLPVAHPDDFSKIQGMGTVYAQRLQEAGLTTYQALAAASDTQLDQLTDGNLERVKEQDWRGQAARLAQE